MNKDEIRAMQAPLKQKYKDDPAAALVTMSAEGKVGEGVTCSVATGRALVEAGLHPATGGPGTQACSGDMLLQALVACAGVTLAAVSTAMGIPLKSGSLRAEGDLDFRGTLGTRDVPVGFREIRLIVTLDTTATAEEQKKLIELTERYCVIYQTLKNSPTLAVSLKSRA